MKRNLSQTRRFPTILHLLVPDFKKKLFTNYDADYQLNSTLLGENDLLMSSESKPGPGSGRFGESNVILKKIRDRLSTDIAS